LTAHESSPDIIQPRSKKLARWLRVATLVLVIGGMWIVAWQTGLYEYLTIEHLRTWVNAAGWMGIALFVVAYCVANAVHVPGTLFMVVAIIAWGDVTGALVAWLSSVLAVSTTFMFIRQVGGKALADLRHPWVRRILAGIDNHPVVVVAVLRLLMQASPPLNYALALTSIKRRHYVIGSAIGLLGPVGVVALFTEWFLG
jgi:uncharacterized membrane protein YdjX (TVP38/TMEM64 family)